MRPLYSLNIYGCVRNGGLQQDTQLLGECTRTMNNVFVQYIFGSPNYIVIYKIWPIVMENFVHVATNVLEPHKDFKHCHID